MPEPMGSGLGRPLSKLARHDISRWALTGGFAVEIHLLRRDRPASIRTLNDLDFIAEGLDCAPATLAGDFFFRHVHPFDPPGKTLLQFIDADTGTRIDLFRAKGAIMSRNICADLPSGPVQMVSLEDLVARTAKLVLDLAEGVPVPSKRADDYLRLVELVDHSHVEAVWMDHRKPKHPLTFRETNAVLRPLISSRPDLLINPEYSEDIAQVCSRCMPTPAFRLGPGTTPLP